MHVVRTKYTCTYVKIKIHHTTRSSYTSFRNSSLRNDFSGYKKLNAMRIYIHFQRFLLSNKRTNYHVKSLRKIIC